MANKGKKGMNSKYSEARVDKIVATLRTGVPKKYACQLAGITISCLNDWEHGKGGIPADRVDELNERIMEATAAAVSARVGRIAVAGQKGDWKADAWYLEHVHADDFAKSSRVQMSGDEDQPVKVIRTTRVLREKK